MFRKDEFGDVYLRGLITLRAASAGLVVANLPAGRKLVLTLRRRDLFFFSLFPCPLLLFFSFSLFSSFFPSLFFLLFFGPGARPRAALAFVVAANGNVPSQHRMDIYNDGSVNLVAVTVEAPFVSLDGVHFATDEAGWIDANLTANYNNDTSTLYGWQTPQYRVRGERVDFRGLANRAVGTVVAGETVASVPVGARPPMFVAYPTIAHFANASHRMDVNPSGDVIVSDASTKERARARGKGMPCFIVFCLFFVCLFIFFIVRVLSPLVFRLRS
jgi:hypothetical protein